ncbi:MAG: PepSY-associated TM helix domain-containing protein [Alistipes sp.]
MPERKIMSHIRRWSRAVHRDLSFFFGGIVLIYAISGFTLNHKHDFNAEYAIHNTASVPKERSRKANTTTRKNCVLSMLEPLGEATAYTKHYFPDSTHRKRLSEAGRRWWSTCVPARPSTNRLRKRPLLSVMNRLHYNPGRWWTVFSDVFAGSLVLITLTGLVMVHGGKGLWGRGGIELVAGILFPLLFIVFS